MGIEFPPYFLMAYTEISKFIEEAVSKIRPDQVNEFINELERLYHRGNKVLVVGAGRSGLVARGFAMRLMHLGYKSYVLGETITPSVGSNDLVVAISGSGTTSIVVAAS
ncbi:MAG: SIS domain-containing protein, partial [Caldivirga sp.]